MSSDLHTSEERIEIKLESLDLKIEKIQKKLEEIQSNLDDSLYMLEMLVTGASKVKPGK